MIRTLAVRFERVSTKVGVGVAVFAMAYMAIAVAHAPSPPPLGLRPEPASSLGHSASVNYRKGEN